MIIKDRLYTNQSNRLFLNNGEPTDMDRIIGNMRNELTSIPRWSYNISQQPEQPSILQSPTQSVTQSPTGLPLSASQLSTTNQDESIPPNLQSFLSDSQAQKDGKRPPSKFSDYQNYDEEDLPSNLQTFLDDSRKVRLNPQPTNTPAPRWQSPSSDNSLSLLRFRDAQTNNSNNPSSTNTLD